MERQYTSTGALARLGFSEPSRTVGLLDSPVLQGLVDIENDTTGITRAIAHTADPDLTLFALVRLLEAAHGLPPGGTPGAPGAIERYPDTRVDQLRGTLDHHCPERDRLLGVLGASTALGDHLVSHPDQWTYAAWARPLEVGERRAWLVDAVLAAHRGEWPGVPSYDALRIGYRAQMLGIAALDVTAVDPTQTLPATASALADVAAAALEAGLAIAVAEAPQLGAQTRLAVLGMGKTGGGELNYVSDVDVIFVAEPTPGTTEDDAIAAATLLATSMIRACSASTSEGTLWPVDAALRPEGKQGPLVRTVASHVRYYQRWAKTWEFQALLKARVVAGDAEVGQAYLDALEPMVWQAAGRENFVEDVQAMRRRVEKHVPTAEAKRQLKLGPGGLRDVEFSVQLLQLVHGRVDGRLRSRNTLAALAALAHGGYVGREDAAELDASYRLLRTLEHRIQMYRMRRTHLMPTASADLRRLGRALGHRVEPEKEVVAQWQAHAREVRRIHERLFYRPLLAAAAKLGTDDVHLTDDAARARLRALGFRDPAGSMRHLEALTAGYTRTAAMQRTLLPIMLGWFADEADPDAGLLAFRRVSESLTDTHWYLKMLRDSGHAADRLAHVLARSRFAADLLERAPESVRLFADDEGLVPRTKDRLLATMRSAIRRKDDPEEALSAARVLRRQELFRIVVADLLGLIDLEGVGLAVTALNEALLEAVLYIATYKVSHEQADRPGEVLADIAIIGMGRLGGSECGYGSDADAVFVHRPRPGIPEPEAYAFVAAVVQEMRRELGAPGPDPGIDLDTDLRPEGKAGPLTRTIEGYRAYYQRWSVTWESQALLRARPVAGDEGLGTEFIDLVNPLRYPADGVPAASLKDIRRLKARMESERLPRGADPKLHMKLGRGGLSDTEWTIQLLQLRHGATIPGLRTTRTLAALAAARTAGLIGVEEADHISQAWTLASATRNAVLLWRGRLSDSVPTDVQDAEGVSRIIGGEAGSGAGLSEHYLRTARRARAVTERVFFGQDGDGPRAST